MRNPYRIGIEAPEKQPEVALTCDQMRIAIDKAARDSYLIRQCLDVARYTGKNGEDTYVLLAYQALVALEVAHRNFMELSERTVKPWTMELKCTCKPIPGAVRNSHDHEAACPINPKNLTGMAYDDDGAAARAIIKQLEVHRDEIAALWGIIL